MKFFPEAHSRPDMSQPGSSEAKSPAKGTQGKRRMDRGKVQPPKEKKPREGHDEAQIPSKRRGPHRRTPAIPSATKTKLPQRWAARSGLSAKVPHYPIRTRLHTHRPPAIHPPRRPMLLHKDFNSPSMPSSRPSKRIANLETK